MTTDQLYRETRQMGTEPESGEHRTAESNPLADARLEEMLSPEWVAATTAGRRYESASAPATAIYCRFSPAPGDREVSIVRQFESCKTAIEAIPGRWVDESLVYADRYLSGASIDDRIELPRLIEDAKLKKFDMVFAESPDRLSRDPEHLSFIVKTLNQLGVEVRTSQKGVLRPSLAGLYGLLGAEQLIQLRARLIGGKHLASREGRYMGGPAPYGYRRVEGGRGALEIDHEETAIVRRIFSMFDHGTSQRAIARHLTDDGVEDRSGDKRKFVNWLAAIPNILRRSLYRGVITLTPPNVPVSSALYGRAPAAESEQGQASLSASHLAIVEVDLWNRVQARLSADELIRGRRAPSRHHLLANKVYCPCGSIMTYNGGGKRLHTSFTCSNQRNLGGCKRSRSISSGDVEASVLRMVRDDVLAPDRTASDAIDRALPVGKSRVEVQSERKRLRRSIARLTSELEDTFDPQRAGGSMSSRIAELRRGLESQIRSAEAALAASSGLDAEDGSDAANSDHVREAVDALLMRDLHSPRDTKYLELREVIRGLIKRVDLDLSQHDGSYRIQLEVDRSGPPPGNIFRRRFSKLPSGYLGNPDRVAAGIAAAEKGTFALAEEDWNSVSCLFDDLQFHVLEPRRAFDAMLFHAWTSVPLYRTPKCFGSHVTLRAACVKIVRRGIWRRALALLQQNASPAVDGIDETYFDHWLQRSD